MRVPKSICAIVSAADVAAVRYALAGVMFGRNNKKPYAVATDGRRLIHATWNEDELPEFDGDDGDLSQPVIVPVSTVKEMAALCNGSKGADKRVSLSCADGKVVSRFSKAVNRRLTETTPVEGRFPKWEEVLPKNPPLASIDMGGALLADTLKAVVAALECKGSNKVTLTIYPDSEGKPHMLQLAGENGGKTVTAIQMGLS